MPSLTQEIYPFTYGVSQEPDVVKQPGYLNECQNGYPDIVFGLQKRTGGTYVNTLLNTSNNPVSTSQLTTSNVVVAQWFTIIRHNDSPYLGCIVPANISLGTLNAPGQIRIWNLITGAEMTVNYAVSTGPTLSSPYTNTARDYLNSSNRDDYKIVTTTTESFILNRSQTISASSTNTTGTLTGTVSTFASLPTSPSTDQIYRIRNSQDTKLDDYYVKWDGNSWEEVVKPGISNGFNNWQAPHVLVKQNATTFKLQEGSYTERTVGDDVTNRHPSFVGKKIEDVFFYFNRLGFLSNDNIILSKVRKPDFVNALVDEVDFYRRSAQVLIASDPVDLSAASVRSITLRSVLPAPQGLILFADNEQFMLQADSAVITPETAVVKTVSNYEMDDNLQPVELGNEFYFVSKTPRYTRCFRMIPRGEDADPITQEASKVASNYIPADVTSFSANPQNQTITLSAYFSPFLYFYKQFLENGQRVQQAWFKWKYPGNILHNFVLDDYLYAILHIDSKVVVVRSPLNKSPADELLTNVDNPFGNIGDPAIGIGPHLDCWVSCTQGNVGAATYDSSTNRTTVPLPTNYPITTGKKYLILTAEPDLQAGGKGDGGSGGLSGNSGVTSGPAGTFHESVATSGNNFLFTGDLTADQDKFVIGYAFDMIFDLSTTYARLPSSNTDFTASLVISRYKFSFANSGAVSFKIQGYDRTEYEEAYSVINSEFYKADNLPVFSQVQFTVPIHQRNDFFTFRVFSDSPLPATMVRLMWEGIYTPRYYQRS